MRKKLVIGNWKMNGSLALNEVLLRAVTDGLQQRRPECEVGVAAPYPYLPQVQAMTSGSPVQVAAQDVSEHEASARTGEVCALMLRDFGVRFCLVGHSERRQYHGESSEQVAVKAQRLLAVGITPVVCVGETLQQRQAGETAAVVSAQLHEVLSLNAHHAESLVIAYEPVWAIGTGQTATPQQAQEVHALLRAGLRGVSDRAADRVRILYGGSMNAANAAQLLAQEDIDGGLIGGASLKAGDFLQIIAAAA